MKRVSVDGVVTRVLRVTLPEALHEALLGVAYREGISVIRVVRAAIQVGTARVLKEYALMDKGEANRVASLRDIYESDRRLRRAREKRVSKTIERKEDGGWRYTKSQSR